jgi:hypothetical protein
VVAAKARCVNPRFELGVIVVLLSEPPDPSSISWTGSEACLSISN